MKRKISVIGLGYVGLPVAVAFGKKTTVIGFDINKQRLSELRNGKDSSFEVDEDELKEADILFTSNPDDLRKADFHIVAVPTPINEAKQPDLTALLAATKTIGNIIKSGDIVVYESTVYPGCTEEDCAPILEKQSGLKYINSDFSYDLESLVKEKSFYLGYSPERINPSDKEHTFTKIKKLVSGSTPEISNIIAKTYLSVVNAGVHKVSSIKIAEAAKVIENAQRDLNIAFVNELALIFNRLGIDTHEVLIAAGTKWNFLSFSPGLVGGHCIGVDPYYLTYKAEKAGYHPRIILAGRQINDGMGRFVAQQTVKTMAKAGFGSVGAIVTVFGLSFKENCVDIRNSLVPDILTELKSYGCKIQVSDPIADSKEAMEKHGISLCNDSELKKAHGIILAVPHRIFREWLPEKWITMLVSNGIVVDINNIIPTEQFQSEGHLVWRL